LLRGHLTLLLLPSVAGGRGRGVRLFRRLLRLPIVLLLALLLRLLLLTRLLLRLLLLARLLLARLLLLLLLLVFLLLLLLLLLLALLLELLLELGHLPLDELVVELRVGRVRCRSERAAVARDRLGVASERRLRIRRLGRLAETILRVARVVGDARGARRIGVAGRHLLERVHRVAELPLPVGGVAEVEVGEGRIGLVGERLLVVRDRIVVLAGGIEARRLPRLGPRVEPGDRHGRERDGRETEPERRRHVRAPRRRRHGIQARGLAAR